MNTVYLSGNLTRDVELRFLPSGTAIGAFGIASNRKWTDGKTGEKKEEVCFVDITAFGKQAETIAQYFKKGAKILLTGRLQLDQWDDKKTGEKRSKLKVVLESFEFMGGKNQGGETDAPQRGVSASDLPTGSTPAPGTTNVEEDSIPFRATPRTFNHARLA